MWFIGVEIEQETSAPPPKKTLDPPLHGIAVLFVWPLLSMVGQYLKNFRLNGK